jgi:hypothetical protein
MPWVRNGKRSRPITQVNKVGLISVVIIFTVLISKYTPYTHSGTTFGKVLLLILSILCSGERF